MEKSQNNYNKNKIIILSEMSGDWASKDKRLPGGPVVKTLHLHCKGRELHPWLGNEDLAFLCVWPK